MKLAIIGRGNAGCISALHFAFYRNVLNTSLEIELIFDSKIPPVPTGIGTNLSFPQLVWQQHPFITYLTKFPSTLKMGIMYENWGKKNKEIFHPFQLGQYALHFDPKDFQDFVCENLKINFKERDENITSYSEIDADYIVDCRGKVNDLENYTKLINPLNCSLLGSLPKKENDVKWTRTIATPDGWCFYIPLPNKTALGYIFNTDITSVEEATENFKNLFKVKKIDRVYPFDQYLAKEMIVEDRICLNGNRLFFLEPLEATAMHTYLNACKYFWDYIFNEHSKMATQKKIDDYVYNVQDFVLWHYGNGSVYNTKFWEYAKELHDAHLPESFKKYVRTVKGMTENDIRKSLDDEVNPFFAQWKKWSFKIWYEGMNNEL